ncbi:hypothetical protein [Rhodopirellula bahusiensis]|uniref:hypothetical protein n=1 Tax=Rhodopirellula bahusiensis TaxID=2014065 RepID=UPI0032638791
MDIDPKEPVDVPLYSARRRFDLASIIVATTFYAGIFAFCQAIGAPVSFTATVGAFIALVAITQALLWGGAKPRLASVLTGSVTFVVVTVVSWRFQPTHLLPSTLLSQMIFVTISGAFWGYIAGTLVGSVFMVADRFRRRVAK